MGSRRRLTVAALAVLVAGAATAAILLNLALLGYAEPRNDPVGKLSPRAVLTQQPTTPARVQTVTVQDDRRGGDGRGRGGGNDD
jgi:hypothetical protein